MLMHIKQKQKINEMCPDCDGYGLTAIMQKSNGSGTLDVKILCEGCGFCSIGHTTGSGIFPLTDDLFKKSVQSGKNFSSSNK